MTQGANKHDPATVASEFITALSQGDREAFTSFLDADVEWHSAGTGETERSRETVALNLFSYRNTFPDFNEEMTNLFASDDQVAVESLVTGTYDGAVVPTVPGSGRHVRLPICYILRVRDGKITHITTYLDYRTLMAQLDLIAVPS
jgi:steroid delta-isomerase-like uncharacterized protein